MTSLIPMTVFYMSLALMYGSPSTIGRLWYNQSAAACGNVVGGAVFIGLTAHLMNHWKSPVFRSSLMGTLMAHDVESTRRARVPDPLVTGDTRRASFNDARAREEKARREEDSPEGRDAARMV